MLRDQDAIVVFPDYQMPVSQPVGIRTWNFENANAKFRQKLHDLFFLLGNR